MVSVPSFLLKRLYVKKSLKNIENGYQFELKNVLAEATITSPIKIYLNDKAIEQKNIMVSLGDNTIKSEDINSNSPLKFAVGSSVLLKITDKNLAPAQYKIDIKAETKEFGEISFSTQDSL
jgi:hypothetical protein